MSPVGTSLPQQRVPRTQGGCTQPYKGSPSRQGEFWGTLTTWPPGASSAVKWDQICSSWGVLEVEGRGIRSVGNGISLGSQLFWGAVGIQLKSQ